MWTAARVKHQRLLRPALGSADRHEELEELLTLEAGRASEAMGAIVAFQKELLNDEAAGTRERAGQIAGCFKGVAAILDT